MISLIRGGMKKRVRKPPTRRPQMPFRPRIPVGTLQEVAGAICQQSIHSIRTYACLLKASILISLISEVSTEGLLVDVLTGKEYHFHRPFRQFVFGRGTASDVSGRFVGCIQYFRQIHSLP